MASEENPVTKYSLLFTLLILRGVFIEDKKEQKKLKQFSLKFCTIFLTAPTSSRDCKTVAFFFLEKRIANTLIRYSRDAR